MGRGCLIVLSPSNFFFHYSSMFSDFRPTLRPVFSPCCYPCIPYLFFSSARAVYCLGYPDISSPKVRGSASVRLPGEESDDVNDAEDVFGNITCVLGYRAIVM